jgi:hypothetical protein
MDLLLSPKELASITGFEAPHKQLEALRAAGFWRARRGRRGVILERAHYEAVCAGAVAPGQLLEPRRPKVKQITSRAQHENQPRDG